MLVFSFLRYHHHENLFHPTGKNILDDLFYKAIGFFSSENEQDDDDDHSFQSLDNSLITISDSGDDQSSSSSEPELIDLTEDDPLSISSEDQISLDIEYCPICLERLSDLQTLNIHLCITPCDHVLCTTCSRQLLLRTSRCPLCRENISLNTLMPYCILR